jgi:hypothetical protein
MTSSQELETLKRKVFHVIAFMSGNDDDYIRLEQNLDFDLGLAAYLRKALATPFLKIARDYNPNAKIRRYQCKELNTVEDAVKLVTEAAGFKVETEEEK